MGEVITLGVSTGGNYRGEITGGNSPGEFTCFSVCVCVRVCACLCLCICPCLCVHGKSKDLLGTFKVCHRGSWYYSRCFITLHHLLKPNINELSCFNTVVHSSLS